MRRGASRSPSGYQSPTGEIVQHQSPVDFGTFDDLADFHVFVDGMSLRQVIAAEPTRDYDGRYGADSGFWTTEQFVEAVYLSLSE